MKKLWHEIIQDIRNLKDPGVRILLLVILLGLIVVYRAYKRERQQNNVSWQKGYEAGTMELSRLQNKVDYLTELNERKSFIIDSIISLQVNFYNDAYKKRIEHLKKLLGDKRKNNVIIKKLKEK